MNQKQLHKIEAGLKEITKEVNKIMRILQPKNTIVLQNHDLQEFIDKECWIDPTNCEPTAQLYQRYCAFCEQTKSQPPLHRISFGIYLSRLPSLFKSRMRIGGELTYVYYGLKLKENHNTPIHFPGDMIFQW